MSPRVIFNNDTLGKRKVQFEDGRYWARVKITDTKFEEPVKGKEPQNGRNQLVLYGLVEKGIFSSFIYKCEANLPDGRYWLILTYNGDEIQLTKAEYPIPESTENNFVITATIDQASNLVADIDPGYQKQTNSKPGRYYAILTIDSAPIEYFNVENKPDPVEKGQIMVEGNIWVDKYTGEIKFDPKKNRDDHRHHAVDAITIALTEQSFFTAIKYF
jgi:CRISPR-associated endonuclease Csn1